MRPAAACPRDANPPRLVKPVPPEAGNSCVHRHREPDDTAKPKDTFHVPSEQHTLIARCLDGEQAAMLELVDRYKGQVFGLC